MRQQLLLLGIVVFVGSCAAPPSRVAQAPGPVVWPLPPDPPKYRYEAVLRDSNSIRASGEEARLRQLLTGGEPETRGMDKPLAVAARGGRVYVTDTEARVVHAFDVPRRRFFTFGYRLEGKLRKPAGIAIDDRGQVYVCDAGARRVVKYDGYGFFLAAYGGTKDLERPTGVAVTPAGDRIYVVDSGGVDSDKHEIVAYDANGRLEFRFGGRGREPGRFNLPVDAAFSRLGTLYVLDAGNFRVQAFDRDGRHLASFGSAGTAPGQFSRPRGIATDPDGNVYVTDAGFSNVQVFDPQGRILLALGSRGAQDAPGRYGLPAGVAVDETRRVYVVEQYFHKVEVLRRIGDAEAAAWQRATSAAEKP